MFIQRITVFVVIDIKHEFAYFKFIQRFTYFKSESSNVRFANKIFMHAALTAKFIVQSA